MKGKKQPFPPRRAPLSHEILAKLRNICKRFFWNGFDAAIRVTKCLNLSKSSRISCGCERARVNNKDTKTISVTLCCCLYYFYYILVPLLLTPLTYLLTFLVFLLLTLLQAHIYLLGYRKSTKTQKEFRKNLKVS